MPKQSSEIATADKRLSDDTLRSIETFADAIDAVSQAGIGAVDISSELGNGFTVVPNKDILVGKAFFIVGMRQTEGDHGSFSILEIVTKDDEKYILTDGGTGIHAQVTDLIASGKTAGLVKGGLSRSDYTYVDDKGKESAASTYYLA